MFVTTPASRQSVRAAFARVGWRLTSKLRRPGCLVLTYHRVSTPDDPFPHVDAADFQEQLEWLGRACRIIAPSELRGASVHRTSRPAVLLTFDDGYRSYHDVVWPTLRRLGLPAMLFLITDYADRPRPLPCDRLVFALRHARARVVRLPWDTARLIRIDGLDGRALIRACRQEFERRNPAECARLLDEIVSALDPRAVNLPRQTMSWDEIRAVGDLTTYGAHSHTHPYLSTLASDEVDHEIRQCRDRIQAETGTSPRYFAYPHGDVATVAKTRLIPHGFNTAFSTRSALAGPATDWLEVGRIGVGPAIPTKWMATRSWTFRRQ